MSKLYAALLAVTVFATPGAFASAGEVEGLAAWDKVYKVFSHPRCANCHTPDERPRWSGAHYDHVVSKSRFHGMNVKRGDDGLGMPGMRCTTCHGKHNSEKQHGPPGAAVWHLAPKEMVWWQKSSADICEQVKDPARNGNRTLEEIATHVRDDGLVAWGWKPGKGREPAPGSAEETFQQLTVWANEGAPCPQP